MIKNYNLRLLIPLLFLICTSCSKDNGTESLIESKLERMSGKEMLVELLIKNDNDVNQLARIFECSPSSLKRIVEGEIIPTTEAKNQFKNALNQTLITKEKSLDELDPYKQTWLFKIKFLYTDNYIIFVVVLIFAIIISVCSDESADINFNFIIWVIWFICLIIFLIVISLIWFKGEPIVIDNFKNTIDPIWELLK